MAVAARYRPKAARAVDKATDKADKANKAVDRRIARVWLNHRDYIFAVQRLYVGESWITPYADC
jgi:hypothetical protein